MKKIISIYQDGYIDVDAEKPVGKKAMILLTELAELVKNNKLDED